jgi:hypothetical protein
MAQIDQDLYRDISDAYAAIDAELAGVEGNARVALDAIVDVDTATYPVDVPSQPDADAALEIELALLTPFNSAYIQSRDIATNISNLLAAVKAANNHVIANGTGATSQIKLDNFIIYDMNGRWTGDFCPQGWANMCQDAGFNIDNWPTTV